MPRVEKSAQVTLVVLTYRSLRWLDWCMAAFDNATNKTAYRWLIVANDAEDDVIAGLQSATFPWIDHRSDNPGEYYINRVYRAWNRGVLESPTPLVCMVNSDMAPADYWLDQLMFVKHREPMTVPTSLLVESGRLPSGMPEHVKSFGTNPDDFDHKAFRAHALTIVKPGQTEPGRLYMPILVDRQEFIDIGGYPPLNPPGTTGDKDLIRRYKAAGFTHTTALGSVVYHAVCGEQNWP
jgi:GT2 family glycosyltransferase